MTARHYLRLMAVLGVLFLLATFGLAIAAIWQTDIELGWRLGNTAWAFGFFGVILFVIGVAGLDITKGDDRRE